MIHVTGNPQFHAPQTIKCTCGTKRPNHGTKLKFKQSPSDFFHLKKHPFIIEMAENGILDYQGMNQAIYRGATSNIIVDTQSMSIEIGAGNSSHTSNLHIECDHAANVASIQLNSNVVTEFSRSKKLIKYPRVAMTQNALNNGYAAEASTENDGTSTGQGYRVFDGVRLERGHHGTSGTYSSGTYQSNKSIIDVNNKIHSGEWIKLQMPTTEKMQLRGFTFHPRNAAYGPYRIPLEGVFLGSTDGNNWYPIHYFYNFAVTGSSIVSSTKYFEPTNHVYYNHIAFVAYKLQNHSSGSVLNFAELDLFGTPEYDPDAHGTDVTIKSVANVPNTDWLEVYYDAKDLTNISGTIADLSGKSVTGSLNGDVSIDTLNDVKSFSFDGSGDYISGTLTNTGDFDFTVSTWVFETNGTTNNSVWCIGNPSSANPSPAVALGINNVGSLDLFVFGGIEIRFSEFRDTFGINKWHHIVCTRTGTTIKYFINGIDQGRPIANSIPLSIAANSVFTIGARAGSQLGNNPMHGKIANFRLFNRVLSSDEIYQLYAYQKEDFGHGDLSMTLKAGRLGIGTSEPRAALDVRGDFYAHGSVVQIQTSVFTDTATTSNSTWKDISSTFGVTITPKFTNSSFLLQAMIHQGGDQSSDGRWTMYRIGRYVHGDLTEVGNGDPSNTGGIGTGCVAAHNWGGFGSTSSGYDQHQANINILYVDIPNTTSPITYRIRWNSNPGGNNGTRKALINRAENHGDGYRANTISTLVVTEIAQ
jgi:hypothetical protein